MKQEHIKDIKIGLICGLAGFFLILKPILDWWYKPENVIKRHRQAEYNERYDRAILLYLEK